MIFPNLLCMIFLTLLNLSNALYESTYYIYDLQGSNLTLFSQDAAYWNITNPPSSALSSNKISTFSSNSYYCPVYSEPLLGGPDILSQSSEMQRTYTITFPAYQYLAVEFDLWAFYDIPIQDNPSDSSFYSVKINSQGPSNSETVLKKACDINLLSNSGVIIKSFYQYQVQAFFYNSYTGSPLTVKITNLISSSISRLQSFGVKNLYIYYSGSFSPSSIYAPNFPCDVGYYWTGTYCNNCHSACKSCWSNSENTCTACNSGYYNYNNGSCWLGCSSDLFTSISRQDGTPYYCKKTCETSYYWEHNKTCVSACLAPLTQYYDVNSFLVCKNPCYSSSQYLYPDQSCIATCPAPLRQKDPLMCISPCDNSTDFYYSNGTCKDTCPSPLLNSTLNGIKYCKSPCSSGQFIYSSNGCSADCAFPLVQYIDSAYIKYCNTPCPANSFVFTNGSCTTTCQFPLESSTVLGIKYCNSPCPGRYIHFNGTCSTDCVSPLAKKDESDIKFCYNPCNSSDLFLYVNGSCFTTCPSPLFNRSEPGTNYCYNPCNPLTEYLFDSGACVSQCNSPLVKSVEPDVQYCHNPCFLTENFLYPNRSCFEACLSPLFNHTDNVGVKYCENPCSGNDTFLYRNQSCQETCPEPNTHYNESIGKFCVFPCENFLVDYYYQDLGQCLGTCPYPYVATDLPLPKICASSLSESQKEQIKSISQATDTANSASSGAIYLASLMSSSDSTSVCMGPISKMLQHIKFMKIVYPSNVQLMLDSQASGGGFYGKITDKFLTNFSSSAEPPEMFQKYSIHSNFFVNFWPVLFNLSLLLGAIKFVTLLVFLTKSCGKIASILNTLQVTLKWNLVLIIFCGSFGDIVLFTALQIPTLRIITFQDIFTLIMLLLINLLGFDVLVRILNVNYLIRKSKKNLTGDALQQQDQKITKEWENFTSLFASYKDRDYSQQIFLFMFILRLCLFNATIGYLHEYPLAQVMIIVTLSGLMIVYLLVKRPMKQLVNFIQQVILEVILFAFNICVLTLAIMDQVGNQDAETRDRIGKTIVYINLMISILSVVLMGAKFLVLTMTIYKEWRKNRVYGKNKAKREKVIEIEKTREQQGLMRLQGDDGRMSKPTSFTESNGAEHYGGMVEGGGLGNNNTTHMNLNMTTNYLMGLEPEDSSILDQSLSPIYRRKITVNDGVKNKEDVSMGFALELTAINNTISHLDDTSFENQQLWNKKKSMGRFPQKRKLRLIDVGEKEVKEKEKVVEIELNEKEEEVKEVVKETDLTEMTQITEIAEEGRKKKMKRAQYLIWKMNKQIKTSVSDELNESEINRKEEEESKEADLEKQTIEGQDLENNEKPESLNIEEKSFGMDTLIKKRSKGLVIL